MKFTHTKIESMWWSDRPAPLLLRAASHLYGLINHLNLSLRQKRCADSPLPVISIGNLTAGGSGKTPFVIWLAELLKEEGFNPVVVCRGDGGKSGAPQILSHESDPSVVGDEAVLLFKKSGCPVIAGRDRVRASHMAAEYGDIMILDDGFQYRQLDRVCDIVLIPAEGVGNGSLIPAGPLREPLEAVTRADLIVRTGQEGDVKPLTAGREWHWWCSTDQLVPLTNTSRDKPHKAIALTAIARPQRFIQSLEGLNIEIADTFLFPDHHLFSSADIEQVTSLNLPVIVTAKDAVKLEAIWPVKCELWVLEQQSHAEPGLFEAIKEMLT